MDDARLEALLFPHAPPLVTRHAEPDFAHLHQELKRKGVTLQLLWEEYAAAHPGQAYRYSQFCLLFMRFQGSLKRSMRQVHRAGDKLFIDYSGDKVAMINTFDRKHRSSSAESAARPAASLSMSFSVGHFVRSVPTSATTTTCKTLYSVCAGKVVRSLPPHIWARMPRRSLIWGALTPGRLRDLEDCHARRAHRRH